MSLLDAISRVSAHQAHPFIAPIPEAESVEVFTLQDNIPYTFRLRAADAGWWRLVPRGKRVNFERGAYPHEYLAYLEQLPRFYVVTLFRIAESNWLCIPANASDAAQRGWRNAEPRPLFLVRDTIGPLDTVSARDLAGVLLYECVSGMSGTPKIMRSAEQIVETRRQELAEAERKRALAEQRSTLQGELAHQLAFSGAKLTDWKELGEYYEVSWEIDGQTRTVTLGRNMRVRSAGFCLMDHQRGINTAHQQDLASIVQIMEQKWGQRAAQWGRGWGREEREWAGGDDDDDY